jgi:hypothetical protein
VDNGTWIARLTYRVIVFCCLLGGLLFWIMLTAPLESVYPFGRLQLFVGAACIANNGFCGGSGCGGGALKATDPGAPVKPCLGAF